MTKDKSQKACIHYTDVGKMQLHKHLNIPLKKGSQGAIVKGIIAYYAVNEAPKELTQSIIDYMPSVQTASQKTGNALKRVIETATTPEEKQAAIAQFLGPLDTETLKLLGLQ